MKLKTRIFQILGVAAIATIGMTSCDTDACADVECGEYGTCLDGDCVCDEGFSGTDCSVMNRAAFIGTANLSGTVACGTSGNGTISATATTFSAGSTAAKLVMNFGGSLAITCTVTSATSFTVDTQTIDTFTYSGTGTLSGSTVSVSLAEEDPSIPETCTYTLGGTL
ncbi:hypothetical protein N9J52_03400 [Flavobacteriales bacterium]|nr:hypothetical protein [Flavobacteriales bacterium]